jgi:hypothetical protein
MEKLLGDMHLEERMVSLKKTVASEWKLSLRSTTRSCRLTCGKLMRIRSRRIVEVARNTRRGNYVPSSHMFNARRVLLTPLRLLPYVPFIENSRLPIVALKADQIRPFFLFNRGPPEPETSNRVLQKFKDFGDRFLYVLVSFASSLFLADYAHPSSAVPPSDESTSATKTTPSTSPPSSPGSTTVSPTRASSPGSVEPCAKGSRSLGDIIRSCALESRRSSASFLLS